MVRQGLREGDDVLGVIRPAGRVVRAGEEKKARPVGHGRPQGGEVVTETRHRHLDCGGAK